MFPVTSAATSPLAGRREPFSPVRGFRALRGHVGLPRMALAALVLLASAGAGAAQEPVPGFGLPAARTITVQGEGRVGAIPDMAHVGVGVVQEARTAGEAIAQMSAATGRVLDLLAAAGLSPQDVQTGQLSLEPRYGDRQNDMERPRITGFVAMTMLDLRVRDLPQLGAVLDAAVRDGANRLGGIRFDLQDRGPALEEARRRAVADARARAELFAEAAGVPLGEVLTLSEQASFEGPRPMMEASFARDGGAIPLAGGEVELTALVTMVYRIGE